MPKKAIQLSDHFTYSRLLRFVLPCIGTMLFTSIYGIVDGLCVSNFVGKTAFAAVNLIMPLPQLLGTVGFMLGTGGSAIVGITLGEGDPKKADRYFTMFLLAALISVSVLAVLGILLLRPVAVLLGAKGELLDYAVRYGRILMLALPPFALQNMFQSFFVTAEKPLLGFWFTVGAGCTNMVLDVVMVGMLHWGVEGAAVATLISQLVGGVLPVFYFIDHHNTSRLHLCRTQFYGRVLWDACINGSSELMTSLSMSLVNILYNFQLLRLAGENGVAAYGVIMYAAFLFVAVFVGYGNGADHRGDPASGGYADPAGQYYYAAADLPLWLPESPVCVLPVHRSAWGLYGIFRLFGGQRFGQHPARQRFAAGAGGRAGGGAGAVCSLVAAVRCMVRKGRAVK